ncbi:MAG: DUF4861 domain-containing protein, partial [Bacteroidaceae bacterium]|nr:DUF4861 domain-containing protein [Bacteroidaceae bacterium]
QLDDLDGDYAPEELAFVIDMKAREKKSITIMLSDKPNTEVYHPRTFAQMLLRANKGAIVPIRDISVPGDVQSYSLLYGHGIMFESEINAYRIYFDKKQTIDPYGKFKRQLELEKTQFYPTDDHLAQGYGNDILLVGTSCGVGALKGWNGTETTNIEPVRKRAQRVVASGPVRAIVEMIDEGWQYQGSTLNMKQRYTQWAGHRDVQIDIIFDKPLADESFAIGVQRIMGNETTMHYGQHGLVASWGRHWPMNDTVKYVKETIGMATYVPEEIAGKRIEDKNGCYYLTSCKGKKSFRYYTMFVSDNEAGAPKTKEEWFAEAPLLIIPHELAIQ